MLAKTASIRVLMVFPSGKMGSVYKEAYNIPLVVVDPSKRFVGDTHVMRDQFVSSVDLLRMFVSLGNNGSQDWLKGDIHKLYGKRLDLMPLLKSVEAKGREYLLLVIDELIPGFMNFDNSPMHVIGLLNEHGKLGTYSHWKPKTDEIISSSEGGFEVEYYDYSLPDGELELNNTPNLERVPPLTEELLNEIVPNELRAEMPEGALRDAGIKAKQEYLEYLYLVGSYTLMDAIQSSSSESDSESKSDDKSNDKADSKLRLVIEHAFGKSF